MELNEINRENIKINACKCYSCGKVFKRVIDLERHKNRKTPCLIREVSPINLANPNRCIFCNKIFSNKSNLIKHLSRCKIKNGGINILDEKVRYEQEIRILKEKNHQRDIREKQKDGEIKEMREQMAQLQEQIKRLVVSNNTTNNITNNTTNNNITINFYNYDKPRIDNLKITQDDLLVENVTKKLIEMIYFNKDIPENHVLYRPNIKEQRLLVHKDNAWKSVAGDDLAPVFTAVKNTAYTMGVEKINSGNLYKTDDDFMKLYPVVRDAIARFNIGEKLTDDTVLEVITANRELIRSTLAECAIIRY